MKLKDKLKPYGIKKLKIYTVSRTETRAYIFKIEAKSEEEALKILNDDPDLIPYRDFTTDIFSQIED